jgi:hypothetical protein
MGKNLVWYREIERKYAKFSMTTFTYLSSSFYFMPVRYKLSFLQESHRLSVSRSSCDYTTSTKWERKEVGAGLRSWLASMVSVPQEGPVRSYFHERQGRV